jgi:hypothetical protein
LADFDESKFESGCWNETAFHAARSADEKNFGSVPLHQFPRHGQGRDDVATGAATGD